ncbi:MAG: NAD(P)H-dependent flavin oxidoreductase [Cellvibrionaceae bacterium]
MAWNQNRFTDTIGMAYPIIQGPFGGGLSTVTLVEKVSNMGGLGSYGAHILSPNEINNLTLSIQKKTNKPFAINLWVSDHDPDGLEMSETEFVDYLEYFKPFYDELDLTYPTYPQKYAERYEEQVEALLETPPPVFSFVFGIPSQLILKECRRKNIITMGAATTVDEALAIEEAGVDVVLVTGLEAGGHRVSFLKKAEDSLMEITPLLQQTLKKVSTPVVAAGGISTVDDIDAVLSLGAEGVQIGTAFLACQESGASAMHRQMILSDDAKNTVLSRAFTGRLARFIQNEFIEIVNNSVNLPLPFPIQSFFTAPLKKASAESFIKKFGSYYAGQGAPKLSHENVTDLMNSFIEGMNNLKSN